jgi:hypothetical protein
MLPVAHRVSVIPYCVTTISRLAHCQRGGCAPGSLS